MVSYLTVAFDQWFDIIDPLENKVISKFKIETTAIGDTLLASNGLQKEFPAVVQDPLHKGFIISQAILQHMMCHSGQQDLKVLRSLKEYFIPISLMIPGDSSGFITDHLSMEYSVIIILR